MLLLEHFFKSCPRFKGAVFVIFSDNQDEEILIEKKVSYGEYFFVLSKCKYCALPLSATSDMIGLLFATKHIFPCEIYF